MTGSKLLKAALSNGQDDDSTVAAALDVLREEDGCSLLAAVLEVARLWTASRDNRDVQEARTSLSPFSTVHKPLTQAVLANTLNLPPGAFTTINVVPGDSPPVATDNSNENDRPIAVLAAVTVGALWVKREVSRILLERDRAARRPRSRRSG